MILFLLGLVLAASDVVAAAREVVFVDARKTPSAHSEGQHVLVFASRPPWPFDKMPEKSYAGHAFVIWSKEDFLRKQTWQSAWGLYPTKGVGIIGEVPGQLVDDFLKNSSVAHATRFLIVRVDADQFAASEKLREEWQQRKFRLTQSDCVTFLQATARAIGLTVPMRNAANAPPTTYLRSLINANRDRLPSEAVSTAATDPDLPLQLGQVKSIKLSALRDFYTFLADTEAEPASHKDLILRIDSGVITKITARSTRMRTEPGIQRGDNACIYVDASGTKVTDATAARVAEALCLLPYANSRISAKAALSAHSSIEPGAWGVAPKSQLACFLEAQGAGLSSQLYERTVIRQACQLVRPHRPRLPGDPPPFKPTEEVNSFAPELSPDFTSEERAWRIHRANVTRLRDAYSARVADRELDITPSKLPDRKRRRDALMQKSEMRNNLRMIVRNAERRWSAYQGERVRSLTLEYERNKQARADRYVASQTANARLGNRLQANAARTATIVADARAAAAGSSIGAGSVFSDADRAAYAASREDNIRGTGAGAAGSDASGVSVPPELRGDQLRIYIKIGPPRYFKDDNRDGIPDEQLPVYVPKL